MWMIICQTPFRQPTLSWCDQCIVWKFQPVQCIKSCVSFGPRHSPYSSRASDIAAIGTILTSLVLAWCLVEMMGFNKLPWWEPPHQWWNRPVSLGKPWRTSSLEIYPTQNPDKIILLIYQGRRGHYIANYTIAQEFKKINVLLIVC